MVETKKKNILARKEELFQSNSKIGYKDGIPIEKGVILNESYLESVEDKIREVMSIFSAYPDIYLDLIKPEESRVNLFFYQRIFLRAVMRFQKVNVTACLTKDTPVLTEFGYVPISKVDPNIRVWTKDGWQYPENLNARDWRGDFVKLSSDTGLVHDITVTDNHRFWVLRNGGDAPEWVEAKDLSEGDMLLSPIDGQLRQDRNLSPQHYELLGFLTAAAQWNDDKKLVISTYDAKALQHFYSLVDKINKSSAKPEVDRNKAIENIIRDLYLNEQLTHFLNNEYNSIPASYLHDAPFYQLQILKGLFEAGGISLIHRKEIVFRTTSSTLAEAMRIMFYRNNINPILKQEGQFYTIILIGKKAKQLQSCLNTNHPLFFSRAARSKNDFPFISKENIAYMTHPIQGIERIGGNGNEMVWCLQMPNDSFNVAGVEGHNCRAWSKSFITILGLFLQCVFIPGRKVFICAPNKNQGAQIAKEKLTEIYNLWPLLRREVVGGDLTDRPGNYGKDYVQLTFRNKSVFDVVGALESTLGGRRHGGLIDEIKNHDETMINTVVLPLLNVSRYLPDGTVNPKEPNQQTICATSAWQKTSFAYDRLLDDFETAIIQPDKSFTFGCDYRVPMLHGLLSKSFIEDLKMSPSFNETTFATEYQLKGTHKILGIAGIPLEFIYYSIAMKQAQVRKFKKYKIGQSAAELRIGEGSTTNALIA